MLVVSKAFSKAKGEYYIKIILTYNAAHTTISLTSHPKYYFPKSDYLHRKFTKKKAAFRELRNYIYEAKKIHKQVTDDAGSTLTVQGIKQAIISNNPVQLQQTVKKPKRSGKSIIIQRIRNADFKKDTFFYFAAQAIATEKAANFNSGNSYQSATMRFYSFLKNETIKAQEITTATVASFIIYCKKRELSGGTIKLYIYCLSVIYDNASSEIKNPFKGHRLKQKHSLKTVLDIEEIKQLESLKIECENLNFARRLFLLSFYLGGLRFSDIVTIKWTQIKNGVLIKRQMKTGEEVKIPITSKARELLQAMRNGGKMLMQDLEDLEGRQLMRKISNLNAYVNGKIKELAKLAGIESNLHFHCARHSLASHLAKNDIDVLSIRDILGHENLSTTEAYLRRVNNEKIKKVFNTVFN